MGIHNRSCIFLKCEAQAFVEVLADSGVGLDGAWDNGVGSFVVDAFPLGEGDNGEDVVVPFYDVVMAIVRILWEFGGGRFFDFLALICLARVLWATVAQVVASDCREDTVVVRAVTREEFWARIRFCCSKRA